MTESEEITLVGGPFDGKMYSWTGGDYFYAVETGMEPVAFRTDPDAPLPNTPLNHLVYAREGTGSRRFVLQG